MDAVEICNAALDQLGVDRIQSLEDESSRAELCSARFAIVRDAVLGERAWRFAIGRHEIAEDGESPAYGYGRRFPLPSIVVQVLEVSDGADDLSDWQREGAFLLANAEGPIFIRSVDQVEDVALWPAVFCSAVVARLAAELCIPLTEGKAVAESLWALYRRHLGEAAASDGKQGARSTWDTSFVNRWRA